MNRKILLLATLAALQSGCFSPTPPAINPFPRSTPSVSNTPFTDFPPLTYPTPVPEDLKSGGAIAVSLASKEIKVWYLSVVPEQEYLLRFEFPQDIGLYYFGDNSDVRTDSLNSLMKQSQPGKFEIRFVAKGGSYYLALGNANTSSTVVGTVLQLQNLTSPSSTPEPMPIETPSSTNSPTPTPIPTPVEGPPVLNPDPSVPIKVLLSETLSTGSGTDSSRKYQLRFSEPVDPDSLNENLCVFARSPLPLSVESGGVSGSGLLTSPTGNVLFRLPDFQTVWNADKREVVLSFKPGRNLLSDSDPGRQPSHELSLGCGQTPIKDSAGRPRSSGFANENAQNLLAKIYLQQPPQAAALQFQTGEASPQSDSLRLRFNRALFIPTQLGSVGGGLSGLPAEAFAALGKISATEAARNYTLTLERNGQTLLNGVNWAALGGSVEFDRFDNENRTVLLKRPPAISEALSGVFAQGNEAKSFPGPFFTDDADGNGESLALELISKGWQKLPLTINLSENLKNATDLAQDLQSKLNAALKELPEYQRAKDAAFSIKRETNDVLTFSFDDPSGLYYGFRITQAFLSSSSQPLPNRLQNLDASQTLPVGVLPPLYQGGDLLSLNLGENLRAPSGERLTPNQRNLNLVVKP